ncbi:hypothetical protein A6K26_007695 [Gammaproteobacteria bacterium 2W06]|nr:hypothetical protein A6K26_007695 [Gammaproteobacteria bacterium 2W06]
MPGLRSLLITLMLAVPLAGAWLISTTEGARWLAARAQAFEPALALEITDGSLWHGLQARDLRWRDGDRGLAAEAVAIDWSPRCLLRGQVCVDALRVTGLRLDLPAGEAAAASSAPATDPLEALPRRLSLPTLESPVPLRLEQLRIDGLSVQRADRALAAGIDALRLSAHVTGRQLDITALSVAGTAGRARLEARVDMGGDWPLEADWRVEPAAALTAGESLTLQGRGEGSLADLRLTGSVRGARAVEFSVGVAALDAPRRLEARIAAGDGVLNLRGRADERIELEGDLQAPSLAPFWPGLEGQLQGDFRVAGRLLQPSLSAALTATDLRVGDLALENARLSADWNGAEGGRARLKVTGLRQGRALRGSGQLTLSGQPDDHRMDLQFEGQSRALPVALEARLIGGRSAGAREWSGRLQQASLTIDGRTGRLLGTPGLTVGPQRLRLDGHCWAWRSVRACSQPLQATPRSAQWRISLSAVPLALLQPQLPAGVSLPGSVTGTARLEWQADTGASARLTLVSPASRIELPQPDREQPLVLDYDRIVVDADLTPARAQLRLGLASPDIGQGGFALQTDPGDASRPLTGRVWLDGVGLAPLAGALPQLRRAEGRVSARGELAGTLAAPRFRGTLRLRDGVLLPSALVEPLTAVDLSAEVVGETARLSGGFAAGDGEASLDGQLEWAGGTLEGAVNLAGEALDLQVGNLAQLTVSPDIRLGVGAETLQLTGRIDVPRARIEPTGGSAGAIRPSPDAVRVDARGRPLAPADEADPGRTLESDLRLRLGDSVRFAARGASGRLAGGLRLRQVGSEGAEAEGVLTLEEAGYEAYGQSLTVQRGRLVFSGPLTRPQLDIEAVRETPGITAGLRITGPADQPRVRLFSDPAMAQADILAVLLTGRPPGQASPGEEALLSRAALSLGVFGGGKLGESLARELGVEDFQIAADGQGEDAQVAVSGYLSPNLMVRYGVGVFEPTTTLSLRYYLTRQFYLEAVSGAESAFDIFYSFDYD